MDDLNLTEYVCTECGENHIDHLLIDDETEWPNVIVKCQTCGHKYTIEGGAE